MTTSIAWLNGRLIDYEAMAVPVWDLGVVAGASITEMARTFGHQPFRLDQHLNRFTSSCEELDFSLPFHSEQLGLAANEVVQKNGSLVPKTADLGIVLFATAGANQTYLGDQPLPAATVGIHTFALPLPMWKPLAEFGVRLVTPSIRQHDCSNFPVHLKVRNRLHWWMADREARKIQPGARALLLDAENRITETSTAAFYAVIDGTIVTPGSNVLNSLSLKMVQEAANDLRIGFRQRDVTVDELAVASECFVSSTPVGLLPVAAVNQLSFPVSATDSIMMQLLNHWTACTDINPLQQILSS